MTGTDLDVAVRVKVPADVEEPGRLTAPGKKLQEINVSFPNSRLRSRLAVSRSN